MPYHSEHPQSRQWYELPIALFCCIGLLAGSGGVSFANSKLTSPNEANFTLLPYASSQMLKKAYFVIDARPGEVLQQQLRVTNAGNIAGTARLTPVDATTGQAGGVVYLSSSRTQHNVGSWITVSTRQVTLAAGQSQIVPFQVTIPNDALSGQYVGGIVAQNMALQQTTDSNSKGNFQVAIQRLTIIPVELKLPGPVIEQLVTNGIQIGGYNSEQAANISLQNTGNVMIQPHGSLQIMDTYGSILQNLTINIDTFLPRTSINYPAYIRGKALGTGTYRATLTLNYGHAHVLHYTTPLTVTQQQIEQTFGTPPGLQTPWGSISLPLWTIILIALAAIIVLFTTGQKLYQLIIGRHKRGGATNWQAGNTHKRPDTLHNNKKNKVA
ncbi:MAG: DUF916 domain-containing protein [Ktedonobacteraceae bacterium]|nr:DUF916 domain-containing protein [Ktedonobacteraceae bacterium]